MTPQGKIIRGRTLRAGLFAALLTLSAPRAHARLFTNRKGRTIEAEIEGISATHVRLNKGGKLFDVPIDTLSDADRQFLLEEREKTLRRLEVERKLNEMMLKAPHKKIGGKTEGDFGDAPAADANEDFVIDNKKAPAEPKEPAKPDEAKPAAPAEAKKPPPRDPTKPGVPGKTTTEKLEIAKDLSARYYLYLPSNFTRDRKWPAMVLLIPGSHNQRDPMKLYEHGAELNGFVVVVPIHERDAKIEGPDVDRHVAEAMIDLLPIDTGRVYLSGFSSGADYAYKTAKAMPKLDVAGVLGCDAGLSLSRTEVPKKTVLFVTCGAGSKRRYDVAYTFNKLLKGKDHKLRFFLGSNTWPPEDLITEGVTWLNICYLRKVSPRDKAHLEERGRLAEALLAEVKKNAATDPENAYEHALMLQQLSADPLVAKDLPPLMQELGKNPTVKHHIEGMKELDRFVAKYLGEDPHKVNMKEEDRPAKRAAERLGEEFKDVKVGELIKRMGDRVL